MSKILVSGGLVPTTKDTLLDARTRVATFSEIANIENPARFMVITVEDTGKKYEVKKLSSKIIGGIVVENSTIDINNPEALVDLGLAEELRSEDEKVRQSNESKRIEAENLRKSAEDSRNVNETNRVSAEGAREASEKTRVSSEETRNANEQTRNSNETKRQSQESTRQTQESARQNNESARNTNESARKKAESERKTEETSRRTAELSRSTAENTRVKNEQNRTSAENTRSSAEDRRVANETQRTTNETDRNNAELSREQAEGNRASTFNTLKGQMQTTIQEGQTAVAATEKATSDAQKVVDNYDAKVSEQDSKLAELGSEVGFIFETNLPSEGVVIDCVIAPQKTIVIESAYNWSDGLIVQCKDSENANIINTLEYGKLIHLTNNSEKIIYKIRLVPSKSISEYPSILVYIKDSIYSNFIRIDDELDKKGEDMQFVANSIFNYGTTIESVIPEKDVEYKTYSFLIPRGKSIIGYFSSYPNYGVNVRFIANDGTIINHGTVYGSLNYTADKDIRAVQLQAVNNNHTDVFVKITSETNVIEDFKYDISDNDYKTGKTLSITFDKPSEAEIVQDVYVKKGKSIDFRVLMHPNYGFNVVAINKYNQRISLGTKYGGFEYTAEEDLKSLMISLVKPSESSGSITIAYGNSIPKDLESLTEDVRQTNDDLDVLSKEISNIKTEKEPLRYDADVNMVICYGQSLSVGGSVEVENNNFHNTLTFQCLNANGEFVNGSNEWQNNLDPNVENSVANYYGDSLFTINEKKDVVTKHAAPISSAVLGWMQLLTNRVDLDNFDYQFVMSSPGLSGASIEMLRKGSMYYERLLLSVQKAKDYANKNKKTFAVPCVFWAQGEGNTVHDEIPGTQSQSIYYNDLKTLASNLNEDIKSITGQSNDVAVITYQQSPIVGVTVDGNTYNYSGPSWAHIKLAREADNNIYMGGAMYQYQYDDKWHPTDRVVVGLQFGINAFQLINQGKTPIVFYPKSHFIQYSESLGKWILSIEYDVPCPPMRFYWVDDNLHNCNGFVDNYGFKLVNKSGNDIISESPTIKRGNVLELICSENPMGCTLQYAINGHYGGGNLCDSQDIGIVIGGKKYVVDNFAVAFNDYIIYPYK